MNKKETYAELIRRNHKTPYQKLAEQFDTDYMYVYQIASGIRKPIRGKGLKIKKALEKLINQ